MCVYVVCARAQVVRACGVVRVSTVRSSATHARPATPRLRTRPIVAVSMP